MTAYRLRIAADAQADLERLFVFLVEHDTDAALRARAAIERAYAQLSEFPFAYRKAGDGDDPFLRELLIGFGGSGYVALYRIDEDTVTVAAVRHQREDDYR